MSMTPADRLAQIRERAEALRQHSHPIAPDFAWLLDRVRKLERVAAVAREYAGDLGKAWARKHQRNDHLVTLDHKDEMFLAGMVNALCDALAALDQEKT